jgi:hypothetical protein
LSVCYVSAGRAVVQQSEPNRALHLTRPRDLIVVAHRLSHRAWGVPAGQVSALFGCAAGVGVGMSIHRTIGIRWKKVPFDSLPADIRAVFSDDEARAYRTGPSFFRERASECQFRPMKKFLRLLGKADSMDLHLYGGMQPEFQVYFGINIDSAKSYIQFRLPSGHSLPGNPPGPLSQLYQDMGGLIDGREVSVYWETPEDLKSIAAHRWQPTDTGGCDLSKSYPLFSCGNGDAYGYAGSKKAFLFDHERSCLEPYDLVGYAEEYFGDYPRTMGRQ